MEHEYVYAAHPGAGVDELHAVVDWFDRIAYPIRDASTGTLLAFTTDEGEVAEQYAWSPFGRLLDRDALPGPTTPPSYANGFNGGRYVNFNLRVGHHGLFAEPTAGVGQSFDPQALALRVGRPSIYHNRNRTYDPHLGRFLQHDPNATGQTLSGLALEGKLGWTPPTAFDHSAWFGDGGNLYTAYGHDPVNATDPSGLFFGGLISAMLNFANRMYYDTRVWTGGMAAANFADDLLMADFRGTGPLMGAGGVADDVLEGILDVGRRIEWSGLSIGHVLQPKHNWNRLGVATIDEAKYYMQSAFDNGVLISSQSFSRGEGGTSYLYRLELWTGEVVEARFSDTKGVLHAVDGWVKE